MPDMPVEVQDLLKKAAALGAREALDAQRKKRIKEAKQFRDRRLRNTRKLLENFRRLKKHAEGAVYSSMQEEVEDIINEMWDPYNRSEQIVFSIKTSATKTGIIMAHVETMLEQYRELCDRSPHSIDKDRAYALYARYIDEDEKTVEQIAGDLSVDKRTVYNYIDKALNDVAAFMFGIDGIMEIEDDA